MVDRAARHSIGATTELDTETFHGHLIATNDSSISLPSLGGTYSFLQTQSRSSHMNKGDACIACRIAMILTLCSGCYRDPTWPWWRQPFPWWTMLFLVPLYSTCSSLSNLQSYKSIQLPVMVIFSCAAYAANKGANLFISGRGDIVSAFGAFVIGICGNVYSRVVGGTAFTSMVTGVLFLVPVSDFFSLRIIAVLKILHKTVCNWFRWRPHTKLRQFVRTVFEQFPARHPNGTSGHWRDHRSFCLTNPSICYRKEEKRSSFRVLITMKTESMTKHIHTFIRREAAVNSP